MKITAEMVRALDELRDELVYRACMNDRVAEAFALLDNGGVFEEVDQARHDFE